MLGEKLERLNAEIGIIDFEWQAARGENDGGNVRILTTTPFSTLETATLLSRGVLCALVGAKYSNGEVTPYKGTVYTYFFMFESLLPSRHYHVANEQECSELLDHLLQVKSGISLVA